MNCSYEFEITGHWRNVIKRKSTTDSTTVRSKVQFTTPLKGRRRSVHDSDDDETSFWGGMRNPNYIARCLPGYRSAGARAYRILQDYFDNHREAEIRCLEAIGSEAADAGPTDADRQTIRRQLLEEFPPVSGSQMESNDTLLQPGLILALGRAFGDPDADMIYEWLVDGAPAGISRPILDPGGIFPPDNEEQADGDIGLPDHHNHSNYYSVDGDEAAEPEIDRLIKTGFVKEFSNYEALREWLRAAPHLSKLGMITKGKGWQDQAQTDSGLQGKPNQ